MPVVLLRFPELAGGPPERPRQCPHCGSQILQRWGRAGRKARDSTGQPVEIYRYKCGCCARTFRGYPPGLDQNKQTSCLRHLAGLARALGLSSREVADFIQNLGLDLSHVTIWRYSQEILSSGCGREIDHPAKKYSLDKDFMRYVSPKLGVVILLDLGDQRYEVLGTVDEINPREVKAWLEPWLRGTDIQVSCLDTGILNQV